MTVFNVLGFGCDVVDGKIESVNACTTYSDVKWSGEAMCAHFPYESWGHIRSSEVYINNMKENFKRLVNETQKCGEASADFLTECGDYEGAVMLCCEPTFYWSMEGNHLYRVIVDFQFICENEDESTDEQCNTVFYMTEEVFNDCIDVGSPNAQEM
jgi:hypothetical protein